MNKKSCKNCRWASCKNYGYDNNSCFKYIESRHEFGFNDYCRKIEHIKSYKLLNPDELEPIENRYIKFCNERNLECDFEVNKLNE